MTISRRCRTFLLSFLVLLLAVLPAFAADLVMHTIDVGQGDSIFVQFPNGSNMLVDAGIQDAGQTIVNYLRNLGVRKIDILVATHPHSDHIGGMQDILGTFQIGKVWDSGYQHGSGLQRKFLETIARQKIRFGRPKAGYTEKAGDATIDVLAPVKAISGTGSDPNNNSIILRISYGRFSILLTGDAEGEERESVGTFPQSTVLKVAHHGSHNGTDAAFLRQVRPEVAVISCALRNDYGHPHKKTIRELEKAGVKWYSTAKDGSIVISSDGRTYSVKTRRSATASPAPSKTDSGDGYIGNSKSKVFHLPTCSGLPDEKKQVHFASKEDAIKAGYKPCGRCKP